jgi:hypothetical protein
VAATSPATAAAGSDSLFQLLQLKVDVFHLYSPPFLLFGDQAPGGTSTTLTPAPARITKAKMNGEWAGGEKVFAAQATETAPTDVGPDLPSSYGHGSGSDRNSAKSYSTTNCWYRSGWPRLRTRDGGPRPVKISGCFFLT